jgi:hypothetical protein
MAAIKPNIVRSTHVSGRRALAARRAAGAVLNSV